MASKGMCMARGVTDAVTLLASFRAMTCDRKGFSRASPYLQGNFVPQGYSFTLITPFVFDKAHDVCREMVMAMAERCSPIWKTITWREQASGSTFGG